MTRLLVISDLHFEHRPDWSMPTAFPHFDVAVLAGDVDGSPERAVRRLAAERGLAGRPVAFVPGNHEFWGHRMDERLAAGRAACAGTLVRLLDREAAVLAGVRFVGATLWTDYALHGDPAIAMVACRRGMSDHRMIGLGPAHVGRRFQPEDAAARHAGDRTFIEAELARPFDGPTVVVTHHAPHPASVAPRHTGDPLAPGFASDLSGLILRARPTLWVHGHVHHGVDHRVGATRVLANPKGYGPRRGGAAPENPSFDPRLVVDVPDVGDGRDVDAASVSRAAPAAPTFELAYWIAVRVRTSGERHVLGYRTSDGRSRVTSPIRSFDPATMTATSSYGNRYVLVGESSTLGLDDALVLAWSAAHDLTRRDVELIDRGDL